MLTVFCSQVYAPSSHSFQSIVSGLTRRFSSMESTVASAHNLSRYTLRYVKG